MSDNDKQVKSNTERLDLLSKDLKTIIDFLKPVECGVHPTMTDPVKSAKQERKEAMIKALDEATEFLEIAIKQLKE